MGGKLTFIDLFAGCGGLSEGFYKQGFEAVAHIEMNHWACETLRRRMRYYGDCGTEDRVLECDITSNDVMEKIDGVVNERGIDVIIGGPPCQAYSTAGRVRDSKGMSTDPRNYLFESYVKILRRYRPRYFVFENVLGVLSAKANGAAVFPQIIKALGEDYNVVSDPQALIHNTADFGVPQIRKRIIIIGVRKDLDDDVRSVYADIAPTHWNPETPEKDRTNRKRFVDVRQAIADLPSVEPGGDVSVNEYYYPCDNEFLQWVGKKGAAPLFDQRARNHNDMDRERFQQMIEHRWTFGQLRKIGRAHV